ncbi:hypothetical protein, partial [Escherichia coli]|uniref:hypothetical protein n=1 Tax=Escherichia coli TaxID=562 RepID=UPI001BDC5627
PLAGLAWLNMTKSARDCHIEYQQGENINHRNAAENGVTQPKSGSFRATHGKEKPTSSWVIFCATVS